MENKEGKEIVKLPGDITLHKSSSKDGGVVLSVGSSDCVSRHLDTDTVEMLIFYLQKGISNDISFPPLNCEERIMIEVMKSARSIQTFLWGEANGEWGWEEWLRMFRKRVAKLEEVDRSNPHCDVEGKKRLLQVSALGVALIQIILRKGIPWEASPDAPPTNLPQYTTTITPDPIDPSKLCQWNPHFQSFTDKSVDCSCQNIATLLVGSKNPVKLCDSCALDPYFKRLSTRTPILDPYLSEMAKRIPEE